MPDLAPWGYVLPKPNPAPGYRNRTLLKSLIESVEQREWSYFQDNISHA